MRFLRFVLGRSSGARRMLTAAVAVGMVSGLASVALLALINHTLRGDERLSGFDVGVIFAAVCVLLTIARVSSSYLLVRLGQGMVMDLRLQLCRQILSSPLRRLEELGSHRLLATLTHDVNALTDSLLVVPVTCINGTIVFGCLAFMAWVDLRLFALLLVAMVFGIATYQLPAQLGMRRFREAREREDSLFGHFRALTVGSKELKLHRQRRHRFLATVLTTADGLRRLRIGAALIYSSAAAWGHLLFFVVIGVLLYARPASFVVEPEALLTYTLVLLYMMTPLQVFLDAVPALSRAEVAVAKIDALGFSLVEQQEPEGGPEPSAAWRTVELAGVAHTYRREGSEHDFTLGPVNLSLVPGELVFLVGGNGSGKTTLAKILVGLYAPEEGEIRLDGRPVGEAERDDYRQLFSAVFSDFHLFDKLLGLEHPQLDERAQRYLQELEISHKVEVRDGVLSTTDLSQGQRKRLALLTAYLEDRPIYLFDEWAADQDPVFKVIFYRHILPDLKQRGKAVVAISHDDRYFDVGDRLLKLEDGQVVYDGPPTAAAGAAAAVPVADTVEAASGALPGAWPRPSS
ncbi:MAG TPA: cyclic peptide export ABC transporter [Thermoanaerobaculia bacterium]|nr:cyclic peptide export ABC transporter [Thermoanaerobaculia bacterium]